MSEDHTATVFADAYTALLERAPEAPDLADITMVRVPTPQPPGFRPRGRFVWAFAAAGFVLLLVGLVGLLSRTGDPDAPPATDSSTTTTIAPTTTEAPSTSTTVAPTTTIPGDVLPSLPGPDAPHVEADLRPFGDMTIEYAVDQIRYRPFGDVFESDWAMPHGGIVETADGYLALAWDLAASGTPVDSSDRSRRMWDVRMKLVRSTTGMTDWTPVDTDLEFDRQVRGRLFEAGGWYWIETLVPTRLFRSADATTWEELQLPGGIGYGFPFFDHRFISFGDMLLTYTRDQVAAIDMATGEVTLHPLPGRAGQDDITVDPVVMEDGLHLFLSTYPIDRSIDDPIVLEEWVSADLTEWRGPFVPDLAFSETTTLLVVGDPGTGYAGASGVIPGTSGTWRGVHMYADDYGVAFFSADGIDWHRYQTVGSAGDSVRLLPPVKIGGRQALIEAWDVPFLLRVSADGRDWQPISLDRPDVSHPRLSDLAVAVVGDAIFVYEWNADQLHAWKVTFAGSDG